jgi:hypothetical protein
MVTYHVLQGDLLLYNTPVLPGPHFLICFFPTLPFAYLLSNIILKVYHTFFLDGHFYTSFHETWPLYRSFPKKSTAEHAMFHCAIPYFSDI